ncbi:deoxyguanosinetriphosphate triphosphohydrolase [Chloroflexota bacterium]
MIGRFNIRQRSEESELQLSPYAAKSGSSRGRLKTEDPCPIRTAFQRDRDRIIHSKSFRRLKHKTQVFIAPPGDHYVTRLTHTLEVSQLARTISRALKLNEDLTEAISLGHDLGHTPFGHIGEEELNELYPGGFKHYEHSLRIVEQIENNGMGLNLTWEVRDGIEKHSKSDEDIFGDNWTKSGTLEGDLCKISDAVAYINHDIGDAIRAGIITEAELPAPATHILGHSNRERINNMVCDIIKNSWGVSELVDSIDSNEKAEIKMGNSVIHAANELRNFLFKRVYRAVSSGIEAERAKLAIRRLYAHFNKYADKLPAEYLCGNDEVSRKVVDYIAGMTDQYATSLADELLPVSGE